ncbi:MAG: PD40 domain-containing protein [Phycisphaeraceae bacterium]|nr:PD40 domain-containing protein [Phycisphaeraceae bacterium]
MRTTGTRISGLIATGVGLIALGGCSTLSWITDESSEPSTQRVLATPAPPERGPTANAGPEGSGAVEGSWWRTEPPTRAGLYPGRFRASPADLPARDGQPMSPNVRQVTFAYEGGVFDPAVSHGGGLIAFASTQHRQTSDVYVKRADSRVITRLTNDEANDAMPAISPDGTQIAFASDRSGSWDIYVMPVSGGRPMRVTTDPAHDIHPSWSPDGTRVVFSRRGQVSGRWELWVTDVRSGATSDFIGYGLFPEWCPVAGTGVNGADRIAFQLGKERGDYAFSIWTIDYRDGNASRPTEIISNPQGALINPCWSPDGQRIVCASVPNDGSWELLARRRPADSELWMVDVAGGSLIKLTDGTAVDLMPVWADARTVYFASDRGGVENLWSLDVSDAVALAEGRPSADFAGADDNGN